MPNGKKPRGYGLYTAIHRIRYGKKAAILSPKGYRYHPWRAMTTVLGLKPTRTTKNLIARRNIMQKAGTGSGARKAGKAR